MDRVPRSCTCIHCYRHSTWEDQCGRVLRKGGWWKSLRSMRWNSVSLKCKKSVLLFPPLNIGVDTDSCKFLPQSVSFLIQLSVPIHSTGRCLASWNFDPWYELIRVISMSLPAVSLSLKTFLLPVKLGLLALNLLSGLSDPLPKLPY